MGAGIKAVGAFSLAAGAAAVTAGIAVTGMAANYESSLSNIATLLDGTQEQIKSKIQDYSVSVKEISSITGATLTDLTDGLYQTVSAFGDVSNASQILETASKSAIAGNATTTDSINLLSAVTKGYGDTSQEAVNKAADLAFQTAKLGQTTFPELASSMGKVIPLASTMKISQEELFGAMATLTGVTGNTAEVTTQLRGTIQAFLQPTNDMTKAIEKLGYADGLAMTESLGLKGSLDVLMESVGGNEVAFSKLFGSVEAKNAVLALAGTQADNFTEKTKKMYEATGAASKAFEVQTDNLKSSLNIIKQGMTGFVVTIGEKLLPAAQALANWLISNMPIIQETLGTVFDFITLGVQSVVDFIAMLISAYSDWASKNQETIDAVITYFSGLIENIREIFDLLLIVFDDFKNVCIEFWAKYGEDITAVLKPFINAIVIIIDTALELIKSAIKIFSFVLKGDWSGLWEELNNIYNNFWNSVKEALPLILDSIIEIFTLRDKLFLDAGKAMFNAVWEGMKAVWDDLVDWVENAIDWLIDKLDFWNSSKKEMSRGNDTPRIDGSHATGLQYVPFDGYIAELHRGERVLTAEENRAETAEQKQYIFNVTINSSGKQSPSEQAKELERISKKLVFNL